MVTTIHTNAGSMVAQAAFRNVSNQLDMVSKRVNTGYKVSGALDDAYLHRRAVVGSFEIVHVMKIEDLSIYDAVRDPGLEELGAEDVEVSLFAIVQRQNAGTPAYADEKANACDFCGKNRRWVGVG